LEAKIEFAHEKSKEGRKMEATELKGERDK
jgi:hypothetical protein